MTVRQSGVAGSTSMVRRLIVAILLVEMLAAVAVAGLAMVYERHERFRAFDVMLRGRADSLLGAVQDAGDAQDNVMLDGTERSLPATDVYVVAGADGKVLGRSGTWPAEDAAAALARGGWIERGGGGRGHGGPGSLIFWMERGGEDYRALRMAGERTVDPGERGGGTTRRVVIVYGSPVGPVWRAIRQAVVFYGLMSVGVLAATGVGMAWVLRRGLAPLGELAEAASGVSVRRWEFAPPARVLRTRELRPLAEALREALDGLRGSFGERERFVSDAAHELKTAVAVLKSSLQLMTMRPRTAAEYEAGLARTEADCARMEGIVGKMLLLARVESVAERAGGRGTNAGQEMRRVAETLRPVAEARGVEVRVVADDGLRVEASREHMELVVGNLLQNAIQHSPSGGVVTVRAERREGMVTLLVEDAGSGIAAADLPHVFERFYRGDASRSRGTGGTGLGLAICKAVVERAGGTIKIESVPGRGTVATVRLPLWVGSPVSGSGM